GAPRVLDRLICLVVQVQGHVSPRDQLPVPTNGERGAVASLAAAIVVIAEEDPETLRRYIESDDERAPVIWVDAQALTVRFVEGVVHLQVGVDAVQEMNGGIEDAREGV